MSAHDDGGPAFPVPDQQHSGGLDGYYGMSLRDYLAAAALQGYIAAHSGENVKFPPAQYAADQAYEYADAMLEARRK